MTLTITVPNPDIFRSRIASSQTIKYVRVIGNPSVDPGANTGYPGGTGYPVTPGAFGFGQAILGIVPLNPGGQTNYLWYDPISQGLRVFLAAAATLTEVVSATDLSGMTLFVAALGY